MKLCRKLDVLYIDTVVEPWLGFYFDKNMKNSECSRTNYALRETVRREEEESRRHHRCLLLRRQSRHGVLVRQAGAGQSPMTRHQVRGAGQHDREAGRS
jgi:hypothetical protein